MPEKLKPPECGDPEALVAWLRQQTQHRGGGSEYGHDQWMFVWNVKAYPNLDFEHLAQVHREAGNFLPPLDDALWWEGARAMYQKVQDNLLEWGIDDAQSAFTGSLRHDCYRTLWDGTEVDTDFAFMGRSSGWLVLKKFEGYTLNEDAFEEPDDTGMDFETLKKLAEMVVFINFSLEECPPDRRVEEAAAWVLFENCCEGEVLTQAQRDAFGVSWFAYMAAGGEKSTCG